MASAPEASRAWLLIEHQGPWPEQAVDADLPAPLRALAANADELGVRVQLIRRPGRRTAASAGPSMAFAGWTAGDEPWLRRGPASSVDVSALAAGDPGGFGTVVSEPVYLVCAHGRRNVCCARFGGPLAQELAARYRSRVWETTHVGGHRFAANLVLLPHGLYYGPVDAPRAVAAIDAYARGAIVPERYRGRAGQPREAQQAEHARLATFHDHGSFAGTIGSNDPRSWNRPHSAWS